jgi:hypothetical protein
MKFTCVSFCFLALLVTPRLAAAQNRSMLCKQGDGKFAAAFPTGVTVSVGASMSGDFEQRTCDATLSWGKDNLSVAAGAASVDIDALGTDLGVGSPMVAFQIKKSDSPRMTYAVYSLQKPPHLVRTITGGDYFRAADTNMEGRAEIWADDGAALDGFDGLAREDFDFAPSVAFRFERNRLMEVSSEFASHYDEEIAAARAQLNPATLAAFKSSDGKTPPSRQNPLRATKARVLEIVFAYLYSGRDEKAWEALNQMWPAADEPRIRALMENVYAHGVRSQADGTEAASRDAGKRHAYVYDTPGSVVEQKILTLGAHADLAQNQADMHEKQQKGGAISDTTPQAILLRVEVETGAEPVFPKDGAVLDIVVDCAGKVQSTTPIGDVDASVIRAASGWKFIPAFKDGHAVASRMRMAVSLGQ